jgi:hypothetical protein
MPEDSSNAAEPHTMPVMTSAGIAKPYDAAGLVAATATRAILVIRLTIAGPSNEYRCSDGNRFIKWDAAMERARTNVEQTPTTGTRVTR